MMAMTWVDRDRRYFIATTSCTLDGESCSRARWCQLEDGPERVELVVPGVLLCVCSDRQAQPS
jgi:hypothetical protein